jgi:peptidoglycan hydrolase-like protein with peptidoglycan-binding domain
MHPDDAKAFQQRGHELLAAFDESTRRSLRRTAGFDRMRQAALRTELAVVAEREGADSAAASDVARRLAVAGQAAARSLADLCVAEAGVQLSGQETAIFGQVRDPAGRPLAGVEVTLGRPLQGKSPSVPVDAAGGDGTLARTETDAAGFYLLRASAERFAEYFARSKEMVLELAGGRFEIRHRLVLPLDGRGGRLRRVDIEVPEKAVRATPSTPKPSSPPPVTPTTPSTPGTPSTPATPATPPKPVTPKPPIITTPARKAAAAAAPSSLAGVETGGVSAELASETAAAAAAAAAELAPVHATKVYLARGAQGELTRRLQLRLIEAGFEPGKVDGDFGPKTERALTAFQASAGLAADGELTGATWAALFATEPPSSAERSLQVTANFEGHGFGLAQGNWDDTGITWGIIGFTLRHGEIAKIVRAVHAEHPEFLDEDFGPTRGQTLLAAFDLPLDGQLAWADSISLNDEPSRLHKPWREAFARFGERPQVQALQMARVHEAYLVPARQTAAELGLTSELGLALCFDAQVQNGGIKTAARRQIEGDRAAAPPASERALREVIAHAVADQALPRFREDVRARKLTLATGEGTVHGRHYLLRAWGLGEETA